MSLLCKKLKKANYGFKITLILMLLMIVDNRGHSRFLPFFLFQTAVSTELSNLNQIYFRLNPPEPDRTRSNSSFLILFRHYSVSRFHPDGEIFQNFQIFDDYEIEIDIVYNLIYDIKTRDTMEFHRPHRPQTSPPVRSTPTLT